jgi:hypothetical protein
MNRVIVEFLDSEERTRTVEVVFAGDINEALIPLKLHRSGYKVKRVKRVTVVPETVPGLV